MRKVFLTGAGDFVSSLMAFSSVMVPIWADTADSSFVSFFNNAMVNAYRNGDDRDRGVKDLLAVWAGGSSVPKVVSPTISSRMEWIQTVAYVNWINRDPSPLVESTLMINPSSMVARGFIDRVRLHTFLNQGFVEGAETPFNDPTSMTDPNTIIRFLKITHPATKKVVEKVATIASFLCETDANALWEKLHASSTSDEHHDVRKILVDAWTASLELTDKKFGVNKVRRDSWSDADSDDCCRRHWYGDSGDDDDQGCDDDDVDPHSLVRLVASRMLDALRRGLPDNIDDVSDFDPCSPVIPRAMQKVFWERLQTYLLGAPSPDNHRILYRAACRLMFGNGQTPGVPNRTIDEVRRDRQVPAGCFRIGQHVCIQDWGTGVPSEWKTRAYKWGVVAARERSETTLSSGPGTVDVVETTVDTYHVTVENDETIKVAKDELLSVDAFTSFISEMSQVDGSGESKEDGSSELEEGTSGDTGCDGLKMLARFIVCPAIVLGFAEDVPRFIETPNRSLRTLLMQDRRTTLKLLDLVRHEQAFETVLQEAMDSWPRDPAIAVLTATTMSEAGKMKELHAFLCSNPVDEDRFSKQQAKTWGLLKKSAGRYVASLE